MNRRERRSKARLCMAEASPGPLQIRASMPPASSRHLHDSEHLRVASIANREQQAREAHRASVIEEHSRGTSLVLLIHNVIACQHLCHV